MGTSNVIVSSSDEGERDESRRNQDRILLDLIAWVGRDPGLRPPNKAVFLAVVSHAVGDGVCTATDQALARASHTSVPTVQRALKLFEVERVFRRSYRPHDAREIRLLTGEQSHVVVELDTGTEKGEQHQQQSVPLDCSPVSSPAGGGRAGIGNDADPRVERLVALLTARGVTEKMARKLVARFPERIERQVEAHRHRKVDYPAGSLVAAIRENWPTDPPQHPTIAEEKREEARKAHEAERQAALQAQAAEKARKRAEGEKVRSFLESLTEAQKEAFDEEAVEASLHRDQIRSLSPRDPLYRARRAAVRGEHARRKLGLPVRD